MLFLGQLHISGIILLQKIEHLMTLTIFRKTLIGLVLSNLVNQTSCCFYNDYFILTRLIFKFFSTDLFFVYQHFYKYKSQILKLYIFFLLLRCYVHFKTMREPRALQQVQPPFGKSALEQSALPASNLRKWNQNTYISQSYLRYPLILVHRYANMPKNRVHFIKFLL